MPSAEKPGPTGEPALVAAARAGDERAFRRLVEPLRGPIHSLCYQMLGSLHDAEDAYQESLLRAWRGIGSFDGRSSIHTWLHRVATNVCLDALRRRTRRVVPLDYGPADESHARALETQWEPHIEPYPDGELGVEDGYAGPEARYERREAIELAFIASLQHLPARQRAVLILRDVFAFSAAEVAATIGATVPAVNSALQRARRTLEERLPERSQQETLRALGDERVRAVVERFVAAFESAEIDTILGLLTDDATFAMPPFEEWSRGRDAVGDSWLMPTGPAGELRYVPTRANGQTALGTYRIDPENGERFIPIALDVLALRPDGRIGQVVVFRSTEVFERFGLPASLGAAASEPG
ncbi:MAG TPA: sigma-70 family RNA polymerase sigma factor [Solirubrobacterales bacterium]